MTHASKAGCMRRHSFSELTVYFLLYSVSGWLYEVFLEVVVYRWGYSDRGVLFGPYCPIYGVGALVFLLCFSWLKAHKLKAGPVNFTPLVLFSACMLTATALELAASYLLEAFTGTWPWQTYLDYRFQFQGRIALSPSLRFGLGGLLYLYLFQPLFERLARRLGERRTRVCAGCILVVLAADLFCTLVFH